MSFWLFVFWLGLRFRFDTSLYLCRDKSCCYPPKNQRTVSPSASDPVRVFP